MSYALLSRLLPLLAPVVFWWLGRRESAWREGWSQRFGRPVAALNRPLWIHAASVGEANSAAGLLQALATRHPDLPLYLTAFTPSGAARLRELVPGATVGLLPLDHPGIARRFVRALRPRAWLVLETECWPMLLQACHQAEVPVYWLSARLGERSAQRTRRFFGVRRLRRSLAPVRAFGVQSAEDAQRFLDLGAPVARVHVTGSLKLDLVLPDGLPAQATAWRAPLGHRPVWLAASTHPGEEGPVLDAHLRLRAHSPEALLVLAPRHPRRRDEVIAMIQARGLSVVSRSQDEAVGDSAVLLVDTLGELLLFYAAADVAFIGGSLVPVGGHNLLEPAALGRAMLVGPHLHSVQALADQLRDQGGLAVVRDGAELAAKLGELIARPERADHMGQAAQAFARRQQGALGRSLELVAPVLS